MANPKQLASAIAMIILSLCRWGDSKSIRNSTHFFWRWVEIGINGQDKRYSSPCRRIDYFRKTYSLIKLTSNKFAGKIIKKTKQIHFVVLLMAFSFRFYMAFVVEAAINRNATVAMSKSISSVLLISHNCQFDNIFVSTKKKREKNTNEQICTIQSKQKIACERSC